MLVSESLNAAIDLVSPRSGPLPFPRLAGFALILVALCGLLLPAITLIGGIINEASKGPLGASTLEFLGTMEWVGGLGAASGALALAALLFATGLREFQPPWTIFIGYAGFLGGIPASMSLPHLMRSQPTSHGLIAAGPALWLLPTLALAICLGSVIQTLGRRSLRFQRADAARQPTRPIAWATLLQLLALCIALATRDAVGTLETVSTVTAVLSLVTGAMVLLGFAYLCVNAVWASIPLRKANHRLGQILDVPSE